MLQLTIKEALEGIYDTADHYLYLYRDKDVIFYVGRSDNPIERLQQHVGRRGPNLISFLGDLLLDNLPASLSWTIELYTLRDCAPLVETHCPGLYQTYCEQIENPSVYNVPSKHTAPIAEDALIAHYSPCLNDKSDARKSNPLPARYRKRKIANAGVKLD